MRMKEKEHAAVCVDEKNCADATPPSNNKEILDDGCFKTPMLLPPRKGVGRRRGSAVRNGQVTKLESLRCSPESLIRSSEKETATAQAASPSSSARSASEIVSCSCSGAYLLTVFSDASRIPPLKETVIDDFALLLFKNSADLQVFQAEIDAAKAKEEAVQRRRQYEENVRLGLVKKKGRKSKAQIEKEKKEEKHRLRREKREQRRRERRERREREGGGTAAGTGAGAAAGGGGGEGTSGDQRERRARKERRERRRERRERRELEKRDGLAVVDGERKERRAKKPRDPNAPKKIRPQKAAKASSSSVSPQRAIVGASAVNSVCTVAGTGPGTASAAVPIAAAVAAAAGTPSSTWMNDAGLSGSVCVPSPLHTPNAAHSLKRSTEPSVPDPLAGTAAVGDKRLKVEPPFDEYKNGLIGIAVKSDSSAVVSGSPPNGPRAAATSGVLADVATSSTGLISAPAWNTDVLRVSRPNLADHRMLNALASVETTHPVDPGHNDPSTSIAPSVPSSVGATGVGGGASVAVSSASRTPLLPSGGSTLFVNTSAGLAGALSTPADVLTAGRAAAAAADFPTAGIDPRNSAPSALLDPLRQAFLSNPGFAASLSAATAGSAANFGNPFLAGAPQNAAAAAFPFLAAHILQQQQAQQPLSIAPTATSSSLSALPSAANSVAAAAAVQFPPGAALGSQLAGAALLGRALPAASAAAPPSLPAKVKQGRWCAMHVKIAYDISSRKERRATPQPSTSTALHTGGGTGLRTGAANTVPPPLCPPSTSNAHLTSLTGGFGNSFSAMAAVGGMQPPFSALPYQQISDPSKLLRQTPTPKPPQGRPSSTVNRAASSTGQGGMHMPHLGAAGMVLGGSGGLPGANVVAPSLPLAQVLPVSGSLTNGTSDAAAQAAMFAALAGAQGGASLPPSNPFLLAAASQAQHPLSAAAVAAGAAAAQQSQPMFSAQRLFDPGMQVVLQQMQSVPDDGANRRNNWTPSGMEAIRQSAAAAQMNAAAAAAGAPPGTPAGSAGGNGSGATTTLDLMRLQMEQQMALQMDRYAAAFGAAQSSSGQFDLMRQQLLTAAHLRQQQQHQAAVAAAVQQQQQQQQPFEALLEMQRQQQQQQLLQASRALPAGYALPGGAGIPASPSLPQGMFNPSQLMSMTGAAAAAANLQQSLYGKNPYSNTLEQLARQKRDGDMMQQGR